MKSILLTLLLIGWIGGTPLKCHESSSRAATFIDQAKSEFRRIENAKTGNADKRLVHLVWFKLKPDTDRAGFIQRLKKLDEIDPVLNFEVGQFADLQDPRAMSDFQVAMQMAFKNEKDYQTYQSHPIHLDLKKRIGNDLAGPPVTYDYWSQ